MLRRNGRRRSAKRSNDFMTLAVINERDRTIGGSAIDLQLGNTTL
jgi:hypothetical protein